MWYSGYMLTAKRELFARLYAVNQNATQAAIEAGYSENSAHVTGCRLLKDVNVIKLVKELSEANFSKKVMSIEQRKARLTEIALENNPGKHGYQRSAAIQAIAELNKMDHVYEDNVINFNQIRISVEYEDDVIDGKVLSEATESMYSQLNGSSNTIALPAGNGDNSSMSN